jgi:uncharacterized protein
MKRVLILWAIILFAFALQAQEIPNPKGYVSDFAGIIDGNAGAQISGMIQSIEASTGAEISVVTLPSLEGRDIQELSVEYYQKWGIGKKGQDNGVLIMVAPNERKSWITVGYGLEGVLPDGLAGEVFRNEMVPRFNQGDYAGGIQAAVYKIGKIVGGETVNYSKEKRKKTNIGGYVYLIFIGIFILSSIFRKRGSGSGLGMLWFLTGFGTGRMSGGNWGGGSSGGFGGFGGFGGGSTGGGGAGGSW